MPSKSYSLKRKAWEELNRIIVSTVPYDNSMVDPDFNLNEHNRLFEAAIYLIDHAEDYKPHELQVAEDVLEKTCYGHRANREAGDLVIAYYEEAQERDLPELEFYFTKLDTGSYAFKITEDGHPVLQDRYFTTSEAQLLFGFFMSTLSENGDLPEGLQECLKGE